MITSKAAKGGEDVELEGLITEPQFLRSLVEMGRETFTGAVRLERDDLIKILYLQEGEVISASTNDPAESVDEILLRGKKISREHIQQALVKRKMDETLGDALLSSGFISRKELRWARRHQIISVLRSALADSEWHYTVVPDYVSSRSSEGTAFAVEPLLIELVVTDPDRARVEKRLAGGEVRLRKSPSFDDRYAGLGLNEDADRVTKLVDGKRTASAIAAEAGGNGFMNLKLLAALHVLGVLENNPKAQEQLEISFGHGASPEEPLLPGIEPIRSIEVPQWEVESIDDPEPDSESPEQGEEFDLPIDDVREADAVPDNDLEASASWAPSTGGVDEDALQFDESGRAMPLEEDAPSRYSWDAPSEPAEERPASSPDPGEELDAEPSDVSGWSGYDLEDERGLDEIDGVPLESGIHDVLTPPRSSHWRWYLAAAVLLVVVVILGLLARPFFVGSEAERDGLASDAAAGMDAAPGTTTIVPVEEGVPPIATERVEAARESGAILDEPAPEVAVSVPEPQRAAVRPGAGADLRERYDLMAREYSADAADTPYTLQFEIVCETSSVSLALENGGSSVWFVPIDYADRPCFRVFWGRYQDQQAAEAAAGEIPSALQGSRPVVVQPGRVIQ